LKTDLTEELVCVVKPDFTELRWSLEAKQSIKSSRAYSHYCYTLPLK